MVLPRSKTAAHKGSSEPRKLAEVVKKMEERSYEEISKIISTVLR